MLIRSSSVTMEHNVWLYGYVILKTFYNMEQKQIEGKIFDLQDKLEICEIALNEVNDCDELEPAYKDIIQAYRKHIADLEEFLKLLPIQRVSGALPPALVLYRAANTMTFADFAKWYNSKSGNDH